MTASDYRTKVPFLNCFSEAVVYFPDVNCTSSFVQNLSNVTAIETYKEKQDDQCCHKGKKPKGKNLMGGSCDKLGQAVNKYFLNVQSQSIFVSGPVPKEEAMSYVRQLKIAEFKGSAVFSLSF